MNSDSFLVSICVPAYNYPLLLRNCLRSVFEQTFTNYEVVITDDSVHNELEAIVKEFDVSKIKYIKNSTSKGSPANWNESIKYASGNLIKILHHDDTFSNENSLQEFVNAFINNPSADFAFSQCYNVVSGNASLFKNFGMCDKLRQTPHLLLFANIIGAPSVTMFSRKVIDSISFDESSKWYVDVIFYLQTLNKFGSFVYINKPLVFITAGSELQVTNTTHGIDKFVEVIYAFNIFKVFDKPKYKFISAIYLFELLKRYSITASMLQDRNIHNSKRFSFLLFWTKFPINYKIFSAIRLLYLRFVFK